MMELKIVVIQKDFIRCENHHILQVPNAWLPAVSLPYIII